jgi:hypothetical protein
MQLEPMDPEDIDPEPIAAVVLDICAVPMPPPPPQAASVATVASRAVVAHGGAAGSAWRTLSAIDMRGTFPLSG